VCERRVPTFIPAAMAPEMHVSENIKTLAITMALFIIPSFLFD
jgi:hypothetical protein